MEYKKYIGVYFPDFWVKNQSSWATFCLFFDEVHLVTIMDLAKDPTLYLKNFKDNFQINILGGKKIKKLKLKQINKLKK